MGGVPELELGSINQSIRSFRSQRPSREAQPSPRRSYVQTRLSPKPPPRPLPPRLTPPPRCWWWCSGSWCWAMLLLLQETPFLTTAHPRSVTPEPSPTPFLLPELAYFAAKWWKFVQLRLRRPRFLFRGLFNSTQSWGCPSPSGSAMAAPPLFWPNMHFLSFPTPPLSCHPTNQLTNNGTCPSTTQKIDPRFPGPPSSDHGEAKHNARHQSLKIRVDWGGLFPRTRLS